MKRTGKHGDFLIVEGWPKPLGPNRVVGNTLKGSRPVDLRVRYNIIDLFESESCQPPAATLMLPKRRDFDQNYPVRIAGIVREFPLDEPGYGFLGLNGEVVPMTSPEARTVTHIEVSYFTRLSPLDFP